MSISIPIDLASTLSNNNSLTGKAKKIGKYQKTAFRFRREKVGEWKPCTSIGRGNKKTTDKIIH